GGVQPAQRVLRDERYLLPPEAAHLAVAQPDQVTVAEPDLTPDYLRGGARQEAEDGQARHALARTGLPDEAESPAGLEIEAHAIDGVDDALAAVEAHGEIPYAKHRIARCHLRTAVHAHSRTPPPRLPCRRGSIQSRRPSPSRLKPRTVSASTSPG